jgi:DNA-binding GntR family transcriptional regulator
VGRLIEARDAFVAESDPAQRARNAIAFNRVILQAAHSDRLRSSLRALRGLPLGDFYRLLPSVAEAQEAAMTTIVTGVRDGDPTRATEAFRDLMQLAGEEISRLLAERGLLSDHPRKRPSDDEAAELVVTHLS